MTKFSEVLAAGITIRESADDGSDFSNPTADYRRLFLGEDATLKVKDSSGTVTTLTGSGAGPSYSSWTPTLTADGGNPALGTGGTATGRYTQFGKFVHAYGRITFGTASVSAGTGEYEIALPVAASSNAFPANVTVYGSAVLFDSSASSFNIAHSYALDANECRIAISGTGLTVSNSTPWTWAANDIIILTLMYEAA